MIKKIDPLAHVLENKKMYLGRDDVEPDILASFIIDDALVLGAQTVFTKRHKEWWFIGSDFDWLSKGHDKEILYLFSNIVPLENGSLNAVRREILLMAFAKNVMTWRKGEPSSDLIKGEFSGDISDLFSKEISCLNIKRFIGFSF